MDHLPRLDGWTFFFGSAVQKRPAHVSASPQPRVGVASCRTLQLDNSGGQERPGGAVDRGTGSDVLRTKAPCLGMPTSVDLDMHRRRLFGCTRTAGHDRKKGRGGYPVPHSNENIPWSLPSPGHSLCSVSDWHPMRHCKYGSSHLFPFVLLHGIKTSIITRASFEVLTEAPTPAILSHNRSPIPHLRALRCITVQPHPRSHPEPSPL